MAVDLVAANNQSEKDGDKGTHATGLIRAESSILMTPAWRWPMSCKFVAVKSSFGTLGPRGTGSGTASHLHSSLGEGARSDQSAELAAWDLQSRSGRGRTIAQPAYIKPLNSPPYATSLFSSIPSTRLSSNPIFRDQIHSIPSSIFSYLSSIIHNVSEPSHRLRRRRGWSALQGYPQVYPREEP